jgi:DNA-binding NarL/FixJ family response regulator
LCDDLIFASKVTATAAAHGKTVAVKKTAETLLAAANANPPTAVILDLHVPGLDVAAVVKQLKEKGPITVIGFGSHVDKERLDAAVKAGCDEVMPRSRFVKELEESLPRWLASGVL